MLIVTLGFVIFSESADATRLASLFAGLVLVISGVAWYTRHRAAKSATAAAKTAGGGAPAPAPAPAPPAADAPPASAATEPAAGDKP